MASPAREKRRSRLSRTRHDRYGPPPDASSEYSSSTTRGPPSDFVTAPPPVKQGRITSGINMLFRQKSRSKQAETPPPVVVPEPKSSPRRKSPGRKSKSPARTAAAAAAPPPPRTSSRLFYSSQLDDDDSVDSYESRVSQARSARSSRTGDGDDEYDESLEVRRIYRYRGFSTSLKHLFLDESLVCASIGCFGLILSQRTEHLLNLRNERRGVSKRSHKKKASRAPSRIVAYGLLLTLVLIGVTFIVWGFGQGNAYDGVVDYDFDGDDAVNRYNDDGYNNGNNNGYNNGDDGYNNNNNKYNDDGYNNQGDDDNDAYGNDDGDDKYNDDGNNRMLETTGGSLLSYTEHPVHGVFKIRDYQEAFWQPMFSIVQNEWYRDDETTENPERVLEDAYNNNNNGYDYNNNGYNDGGGYGYDDNNQDNTTTAEQSRDAGGTVRMFLCLAFLILLGIVGRRRRMRTRYALVRARAQEDHLMYASKSADGRRTSLENAREDRYEGACSHTLCGCYPVDPPHVEYENDENEVANSVAAPNMKKRKYMDCVGRGFQCLLSLCCGAICKCWCQCLSVCALAQEAREVRLLIPPRLQRIDFLTHQPFHEYQKDVNDLRRGWLGKNRPKTGIMPHIYALSKLSRYILAIFFFVTVTLLLTLIFNPRASFSWNDGVVLLATFFQSFLVLYVIHWVFHKSDLSLDGVIKFFAAGFIIATPSAFVFEGILVNAILFIVYSLYAVIEMSQGDDFVNWVIYNYKFLWILGELFNAYVVAAVTEELCKYYTFRTMEHPDLIFLTGLDRKSHEKTVDDGGIASYSFAGHQVSDFNQRANSFASLSEYSSRSGRSRGSSSKRAEDLSPSERMIDRTNTQEEFYEDDNDVRTHRQKAAAVTTAMISVAVGLACAENFLYVFLLGGTSSSNDGSGEGGVLEEWLVLFFRSIFPVHALAAAMQSVNMIRKYVECADDNNHNIGVGRIILPAVILHGTFDAVLLVINVYVEYAWDEYKEANDGEVGDGKPYNPVVLNLIAWISIIAIMLAGTLWYYRAHRDQRLRLILLEEKDRAAEEEEGKGSYKVPENVTRQSEIELV